jgi:hypothetical protein
MPSLHKAENAWTYFDKQEAIRRNLVYRTTYRVAILWPGAAQRLLGYAILHLGWWIRLDGWQAWRGSLNMLTSMTGPAMQLERRKQTIEPNRIHTFQLIA